MVNTTNRELLEQAAKGAGLTTKDWWEKYPGEWWAELDVERQQGDPPTVWNPLLDDGDALRLAARLRIDVTHNHPADQDAWVCAETVDGQEPQSAMVDVPDEARRLECMCAAIVRVAAAIGRAMP